MKLPRNQQNMSDDVKAQVKTSQQLVKLLLSNSKIFGTM